MISTITRSLLIVGLVVAATVSAAPLVDENGKIVPNGNLGVQNPNIGQLQQVQQVREAVSFSYEGNTGPDFWPGKCRNRGPGQSPIDIRRGSADPQDKQLPVRFEVQQNVIVKNTGHGVDFEIPKDAQPSIFVPAFGSQEIFTLSGFHAHTPSEHHMSGKPYAAELHMVMKSPNGDIAVIATFFEVSDTPQPGNFFEILEQALPLNGQEKTLPPFDFTGVIQGANDFSGFFTYNGSLTTPPCTPNVRWHVMQQPIAISVKQLLALQNEQGFTARPTQVARDEAPRFAGTFGQDTFPRIPFRGGGLGPAVIRNRPLGGQVLTAPQTPDQTQSATPQRTPDQTIQTVQQSPVIRDQVQLDQTQGQTQQLTAQVQEPAQQLATAQQPDTPGVPV